MITIDTVWKFNNCTNNKQTNSLQNTDSIAKLFGHQKKINYCIDKHHCQILAHLHFYCTYFNSIITVLLQISF